MHPLHPPLRFAPGSIVPFILSALKNQCILLFLELWSLSCHNNPEKLILESLGRDHKIQQSHLQLKTIHKIITLIIIRAGWAKINSKGKPKICVDQYLIYTNLHGCLWQVVWVSQFCCYVEPKTSTTIELTDWNTEKGRFLSTDSELPSAKQRERSGYEFSLGWQRETAIR